MNRSVKELLAGGRNTPAGSQHRRGRSLTPMLKESDENLDLFSKNRRTLSVASSDDSDVSVKLGRLSVGSVKPPVKSGLDDLLSSTDGGKHDYDWLLTPPGTPIFPSSDGNEPHQIRGPPRSTSLLKTGSTTKASRLSVTQSESNHSTSRPIRSSSVTRPAVSATQYSTYSSNKSSSILNTSSASVSSYIRPSSPVTRSPTVRPSTPTARPTPSRPTTPSRTRPSPTSSTIEKARPSQISRPSTPTSRPKIPANLTSPAARPSSRPSTPTRRISTPSSSPAASISGSVGRNPLNGRVSAPVSRPSSPGPRVRSPSQPVVLPDFSLDAPPNLRTTLPDRPLSAGRSRPGPVANGKGNTENPTSGNLPRRQSSPITTRGRVAESTGRGHGHVNGHANDMPDSRRAPSVSELAARKLVKTSSAAVSDSTGFGRTISKKSLDMAIRHMDIKNGTGGARPVSGTTLFPQSIRPAAHKTQNGGRASSAPSSHYNNGSLPIYSNDFISENGHHFFNRSPENEKSARVNALTSHVDIYESSRYDAILLKEDLKNTNWLHSVDDRSDPGLIFDHGFESLPEPFSPL